MKKLYTLLMFLWAINLLNAQQYPLFTNYITNSLGFNPAVAGLNEYLDARFVYRSQWVKVQGAPQTTIGSLNGRLKDTPIGLGGYFFNDQAGRLKRTGGTALLSFTQRLDSNNVLLSIGISAGYYSLRLSDKYQSPDQGIDNTIVNSQEGLWTPDFNAGLFLKAYNFYAGFSLPQIFERKLNFDTLTVKSSLNRHYYGYLGYNYPFTDKLSIEPSVMIKYYANAPLQYDASLRLFINKSLWFGANYRSDDCIAAMIGIDYGMLTFAYSYDITTSKLNNQSAGSHELTVGLKLGQKKDRDHDGIPDKDDKCPDVPGVKENAGCPLDDRDQDGIVDKDDKCPDVPGVKENQGCPKDDRDQDGIPDKDDKCPDEKGPKSNDGCPEKSKKDSDGDGVPDDVDQCPNLPGSKENSGCPFGDRDNDGIRDDIDKCPDVAGTLGNEGCPNGDRDKDGILDDVDPCPDEAGPLSNGGCPPGKGPFANQDRDGDGIPDKDDKCPNTAGPKGNGGCPVVATEAQEILNFVIHNVNFDYNKAEIRPEAFQYLNKLADWMQKHPEYNVDMEGHTDSRGTPEYNMELSKNRVYAVLYYLTDKGVAGKRIHVSYFGESRPIANNINEQGRSQNRRVEMVFTFE